MVIVQAHQGLVGINWQGPSSHALLTTILTLNQWIESMEEAVIHPKSCFQTAQIYLKYGMHIPELFSQPMGAFLKSFVSYLYHARDKGYMKKMFQKAFICGQSVSKNLQSNLVSK